MQITSRSVETQCFASLKIIIFIRKDAKHCVSTHTKKKYYFCGMKKYQNKYRIPSARASQWNYAAESAYFITICTHNRECFFGNVIEGEMVLSEIGAIVYQEWVNTFDMRPDMNLQQGEFVVMPNHFHAIVIIGENEYNRQIKQGNNTFSPQSKNLASIMRGFKSAVTDRKSTRLNSSH